MSVSFFSPILSGVNTNENWAFLRPATYFFDFGQRAYTLLNSVEVSECEGVKPSWILTAFRIIALCTLIIPLLVCIGIWIYRSANHFQVGKPCGINKLPPEIMEMILHHAGPASLRFGETCIKNREFIEETPSLRAYRVITLLEQCVSMAEGLNPSERSNILADAGLAFSLFDTKRALKLALEAKEFAGSGNTALFTWREYHSEKNLYEVLAILYAKGVEEILQSVNTFRNPRHRFEAFAELIRTLAVSHPKKAVEVAYSASAQIGSLQNIYEKTLALLSLAKVLGVLNSQDSLEFAKTLETAANSLKDIFKYEVLASLTGSLEPQRALEMLDRLLIEANDIRALIKPLARLNPKKALEEAMKVSNKAIQSKILLNAAKAMALSAPLKALEAVNMIDVETDKSLAFREIAPSLALIDLKKALELESTFDEKDRELVRFEIVKALASSKPLEAIKCAGSLSPALKTLALIAIAKALTPIDQKKAAEVTNQALILARTLKGRHSVGTGDYKSCAELAIIDVLARIDPKKASELANTIEDSHGFIKAKALSRFALTYLRSPILHNFEVQP